MSGQKQRGRPRTFGVDQRRCLAELIRLHGARPARNLSTVPVSVGTLLKIAREFNLNLKKGKRPRRAA